MRKHPVDYQSVAQACNALVEAQEKPSVRKLQAKLGGSFSTLSTFLNRWLEQQQAITETGTNDISLALKQALLAETAQAVAKAKAALTAQLQAQATQLAEVQELLSVQEAKIEELTLQMEDATIQHQERVLVLEKSLSAAESLTANHADREAALQQALAELQQQQHAADRRAAVAEALSAEYAKRLACLESNGIPIQPKP